MEDVIYFKRQEELTKLQEQLRLLKRNKNVAPLKRQLRTLNELYDDLQERITGITTKMTTMNESEGALQSALNRPLKINVGKENAQNLKHIIETIPQITSDIHNVNIPGRNQLFKLDETNFLQNVFSCKERHKRFYNSCSHLISDIVQLTKHTDANKDDSSLPEQKTLQIQHDIEGCNNFSPENTISFSVANVIASSPLSIKCKKE